MAIDQELNGIERGERDWDWLASAAFHEAKAWLPASARGRRKGAKLLKARWRKASRSLRRTAEFLRTEASAGRRLSEEEKWLLENGRLLRGVVKEGRESLKALKDLPAIKPSPRESEFLPRVYAAAKNFLSRMSFEFSEDALSNYVGGLQQAFSLQMGELRALKPMLQLALIEQAGNAADVILESGTVESNFPNERLLKLIERTITSLHAIGQAEWNEFFISHSTSERILKADPSGAYPRMDAESCQLYRDVVADLAAHSGRNEEEVAEQAIRLARAAKERQGGTNSRAAERRTHVGYYLLDYGRQFLKRSIGNKSSFKNRLQQIVLDWPEVFYVVGVELITLVIVFFLLRQLGVIFPIVAGVLLLIPASQVALALMSHLTSFLLPPRQIPKFDFSEAIPPDCATMVVVPTLLLNDKQVRHIVEELEVRYLGNGDPNLHFALLTDSPDASQRFDEHDKLIDLCSDLIQQLNQKYAADGKGTFFLFHRHRVYNRAQETWMGWERKRGKLLDLNRLLRSEFDSFPIKIGDLSLLPKIRYVITLDSDTRLPRDTAARLIGAIAHPLNRAVIDPQTNTVVDGYAILQPRVGISIESSRQSRLANIYSGQTGFDIYTHAVSDVYQDLFGEGSFTGKGIYEVDTFQRVLAGRFPVNSLLSHDLIEGAHARAGLVSDTEVIDDYPSHFSAYSRRLHRWVRGDWQILAWLFPRVRDYRGRLIQNPLTLLSRWKIFDNLRRSLIEVDLFVLLLCGWFFLEGGPLYWTLVVVGMLLAPTYLQLFFSLLRMRHVENMKGFLKEQTNNFVTGHLQVLLMLVFLLHQAMVMLDAIVRTLTRLTITHRNLLEWETAAEAEAGRNKRTPVEVYLALTPWFALAIAAGLAVAHPTALLIAAPILALWLLSRAVTSWINRPLAAGQENLSPADQVFLRLAALRTWRFFRQFSREETHSLVPDAVQETPPAAALRISPTNLGMQLDARLAAHSFGYFTLAEFARETERTLDAALQLPRFKGHFLNWYDITNLAPLPPLFISTVDSGNLAASLWTLKQASLGLIKQPLISQSSWQGIQDHVSNLIEISRSRTLSEDAAAKLDKLRLSVKGLGAGNEAWIKSLPQTEEQAKAFAAALESSERRESVPGDELMWWASETVIRITSLRHMVESFLPWLAPEYEPLRIEKPVTSVSLDSLPSVLDSVAAQINVGAGLGRPREREALPYAALRKQFQSAREHVAALTASLLRIAEESESLVREMDFRFLYNPKKKLFSIGYDVTAGKRLGSNYDLLASEARIAAFIAIAKGDVGKGAWFHLGRTQTIYRSERVLISWSGTMFEYLMPLLWMRSYPGTILDQSMRAAVRVQQKYAKKHGLPWGISEAAYSARDHEGIYQYKAFGIPGLALDQSACSGRPVAPYASFLALPVDPAGAARNLRNMEKMGWFGEFGFYESADFSPACLDQNGKSELIRAWMAHHQGMTLLALCNVLCGYPVHRWFHEEPRVVATEFLLHERVPFSISAEPMEEPPEPASKEAAETLSYDADASHHPVRPENLLGRAPSAAVTHQTSAFLDPSHHAPPSFPPT